MTAAPRWGLSGLIAPQLAGTGEPEGKTFSKLCDMTLVNLTLVIDRFCITLLSALEQTHCAHM